MLSGSKLIRSTVTGETALNGVLMMFRKVKQSSQKELLEVASELFSGPGERSKARHYYETYERFFGPRRQDKLVIFEVGVFNGESTKIFSRYFDQAVIIGIDHDLKPIDLDGFNNVTLYQGDQRDESFLLELVSRHAPNGIDIVIDDASHIGSLSKRTFEILFPAVRSNGLYVVEDWGTGYWCDWIDGEVYQVHDARPFHKDHHFPKRIVSHDFGMVGFVKHLVDIAGMDDNRPAFTSTQSARTPLKAMHIFPGTVVLEKA
jgi:hypothetical protein